MALELLQKHDTEEIIRQMFVEKKYLSLEGTTF